MRIRCGSCQERRRQVSSHREYITRCFMNIGSASPDTDFSRDLLGRYLCNTLDEALVTIDPNARRAAGLPPRGDLRPFDFIIIGAGTFGTAVAEHLWFRKIGRASC